MKQSKFLLWGLLILFAVSVMNCGGEKTEKEKALEFAKLTYEFMTSDDFMQIMKDAFEGKPDKSEEKMNEIAQKAGFKDMAEAETVMEKYKEDPEIKEYEKKVEEHMQKIMTDMMGGGQ